jgi:hypothetical protein
MRSFMIFSLHQMLLGIYRSGWQKVKACDVCGRAGKNLCFIGLETLEGKSQLGIGTCMGG